MDRSRLFSILTIGCIVLAGAAGWLLPHQVGPGKAYGLSFLVIVALLTLSLVCAGYATRNRHFGALIDSRGRLSLSRLQMALWTVVILGGWSAAVLANVASGDENAGDVEIPGELLALMGISTTTLVASSAVKSYNQKERRLFVNLKDDGQGATVDVGKARVADLIQGESAATRDIVDLGKLQALFFSLIVVMVYGWLVWSRLLHPVTLDGQTRIASLPLINQAFVGIIAISHAGYIVKKAVPGEDGGDAKPGSGANIASEHRPAGNTGGAG